MADDTDIEGSDLSAILADEIRQAENYNASEMADTRALALQYARGEMPDIQPRPNGSKQTTHLVAENLAWTLPGVVDVFTASDQMVRYGKVKAEEESWALEATEYMNYTFFRESEGYRILLNATYDALLLRYGVVSCYWEPERYERKTFRDKTEMELAALLDEGWQPAGDLKPGKPKAGDVQNALGETEGGEVQTYTIKLRKVSRPGKICDVTCKPENLLLNSTATTIESARFCAYWHDDKTRSDLMEMADDYDWDKLVIENLPSHTAGNTTEVNTARYGDRNVNNNSPIKSGDPIDLYECYLKVDVDGDGVSELIQAWYAGKAGVGQLLGWEEWEDETPFTDIPCYPIPHRFDGESMADRSMDLQRVGTVIQRALIDNSYAVGLPMKEVEAGSVLNPEILISPKFGGTIWKKVGSAFIQQHETPFIGDKLLMALTHIDEQNAKRTGVSRTTMALDPDTLQNQTAEANRNNKDASYSQIELIAKNMAELGWTPYFRKRLKLAVRHQKVRSIPTKQKDEQPQIGPDGQPQKPSDFREINPENWDPNMAVTINTGLGTGSRDRDMAMLNVVQQGQIAMAATMADRGLTEKALEFLPKIRKTAVQIAESSGLKSPEDYYPEISDEDVTKFKQQAAQAAQQPTPQEKIEQAKQQGAKELKAMDVQVAQQEAELRAKSDVVKNQAELEADLQTKAADRENAIVIETVKQRAAQETEAARLASTERIEAEKRQLEREKMALNYQLEQEKMAHAAQIAASKPAPNGDARQ